MLLSHILNDSTAPRGSQAPPREVFLCTVGTLHSFEAMILCTQLIVYFHFMGHYELSLSSAVFLFQ